MAPADVSSSQLARIEARVTWLIRKFEALDARLIALELDRAAAAKRPPDRADAAPLARGDAVSTRPRQRPSGRPGKPPRRT